MFDDPRLQLRIGDGMAMVERTEERFDLALMDLTDPDTPASALYSDQALARMKRVLAPGGALVLHLGSPVFHGEQVVRLVASLRERFAIVRCYGLYIPCTAPTGAWPWPPTRWTRRRAPAQLRQRLAERRLPDLRYYNAEVHPALFALPNYYRDLVQPAPLAALPPRAVRVA